MKLKTIIYLTVLYCLVSCTNNQVEELIETETQVLSQKESDYLDYGIYWFNTATESTKGYNEKTKQVIDVSENFYNPSKPTVIYFHGWQLGSSGADYERENFLFTTEDNVEINTIEAWKEKGWNVAIFYWNQFADELELKNAEAKIWSTQGGEAMRYKLNDGTYSELQAPNNSLGTEAFTQLSSLLATNTSNNIRFVGHSLGNQLASYTAFLFSEAVKNNTISANIMPKRLELLDPFWSKGAKEYLGDNNNDGNNDWNGECVKSCIKQMIERNNLAVTWYDSSPIVNFGVGDSNESLKDLVAFQSERYWYLSMIGVANKHVDVVHNYFWSFSFDAPKEVTVNWFKRRTETGNVAASASTSLKRIKEMMGDEYVWDQVEGRYTSTPKDDKYELKNF